MVNVSGISVTAENCSGCLLCCLACSFFTSPERVFNLSRSMIKVRRAQDRRFRIEFSEDCTACGICVDYCHYGVLSKE